MADLDSTAFLLFSVSKDDSIYINQAVNDGKTPTVRTTTIRLTSGDQKSLERLMELTGGNKTSAIRYAVRRAVLELEALAKGANPREPYGSLKEKAARGTPDSGATIPVRADRGMNISASERDRRALVVSFWQQRASGERTDKDVVIFYGEMEREFPHLLNRQGGDPYQSLVCDLKGYVEDAGRHQ